MKPENRRRAVPLVGLVSVAGDALTAHGLSDTAAEQAAQVVVRALAKRFGGMTLYFARGANLDAAIRDDQIYRAAGTVTAEELAVTYRLSRQRVFQIQCEQRAMRRRFAAGDRHGRA